MRRIDVFSLGNPGTFDIVDKDNPMYYLARIAHEQSQTLYNLQQADFELIQEEDSDFSSFEDAFDTYRSSLASWFDDAVEESEAGDPISSVPSIPDLTTLIPWMGANPWTTFLIRIIIDVSIRWLRKQLDSDTDAKELSQILRKATLKTVGEEEFSILELLANIPVEVVISKAGEFQDIILANST